MNRKVQFLAKISMIFVGWFVMMAPASAHNPELAMLDSLNKGAWQLRFRNGDNIQRICLRTGRELIQIRHTEPGCSRYVVQDDADEVTVQYTCRGNGYGRTSIRKESSGLVQITSTGMFGGSPFRLQGEGRRISRC